MKLTKNKKKMLGAQVQMFAELGNPFTNGRTEK